MGVILETIAVSMVSLATLVLTMVVVQLAMGQFSRRIVQTFLQDRPPTPTDVIAAPRSGVVIGVGHDALVAEATAGAWVLHVVPGRRVRPGRRARSCGSTLRKLSSIVMRSRLR